MFLASVAVFVFAKNNFYCSENISENLSVLLKCKSKMTIEECGKQSICVYNEKKLFDFDSENRIN